MNELHIDIYSDVICPWCYIGKQRLDQVLDSPDGEGVTVRWRAYQLQPRIPEGGIDRLTYLKSRYGEGADAARVPSRILAEASDEGLTLDFGAIAELQTQYALAIDIERDTGVRALHPITHDRLLPGSDARGWARSFSFTTTGARCPSSGHGCLQPASALRCGSRCSRCCDG